MTTRNQHTPGPWLMSRPGYMAGTIAIHGEQDGTGATNDVCYVADDNKEAQEANARLIAAAPELLEACKAGLHWLETLQEFDINFNIEADDKFPIIEELRTAIAQATEPREPVLESRRVEDSNGRDA